MSAAARSRRSRARSGGGRDRAPFAERAARRARAAGLAHGGRARPHVGQGRRNARDPAASARRALGDHRARGPGGISRRPLALGDCEGVSNDQSRLNRGTAQVVWPASTRFCPLFENGGIMYLTYRNSPDKREHQSRRQIARRDSAAVVYLPFADLRNRQEADVERIDSFAFYEVGKALQPLTAFSGDAPAEPAFWALFRAQSAINDLLAGKPIPIGFSHGKAEAFSAQLRTIMSEYFETQNQQGERVLKFPDEKTVPIPAWRWWRVTRALGEFETVFAEEMKETATYFVPRRGIYFTPALVDTADESFPRDLLGHIPQKTREDWKSAGRCLAFNLLSASGFHAARAVEGTMEAYYQLFSGRPGATLKNWNDYIEELRKIA